MALGTGALLGLVAYGTYDMTNLSTLKGYPLAVAAVDTILIVDEEGFLSSTPDRRMVWACQTPQVFQYGLVLEAHKAALAQGFQATDDATLVKRYGGRVKLVPGAASNIKVTRPEDLAFAEQWLSREDACTE